VDQQYFDILKLPSNSLFMVPNRESTVTIGGVSPGCSLYWSLSSVDDSSIRFHGTADETIPATLEVTPRVSGKYDLTLEEKCFHNQIIMRTLYLVVYVQELRRNLRFAEEGSGEKAPF
jgi:hypothetical protein